VPKFKICEGLETTLWDRWEVPAKGKTLKEVMTAVEEKYAGITVTDVLRGSSAIFVRALMNAPGKEKEREKTLNTLLLDLLGNTDEKYVDLTIVCGLKTDNTLTSVEGVPPLRVLFA
jgi:hypothetical protein